MSNSDNLSGLIDEANSEVETGYQRAMAARPRRKVRLRYRLAPVLPVILFAAAYYIYFSQQPTQDAVAVAAELTELLQQARESVEAAKVNGELPIVLPNAALGAFVQYQVFRNGYFLSAQSSGVLVEMDARGTVTIEGVDGR
jgi:hypothetical protein